MNSVPMKEFQKKIFFLDDAIWVSDKKSLSQIRENGEEELLFFVYLDKTSEALDELILQARDSFKTSKIIYVMAESAQIDQLSHKTTPVGGDVYVSHKDDQQSLIEILGNMLKVESKNTSAKQAISISNAFDPELEKSLKELCELPENKEIELLFSQVFENKKNIKTVLKDTPRQVAPSVPDEIDLGVDMSDKDQELSLDDLGDLELGSDGEITANSAEEEGLDLAIDDDSSLDLSDDGEIPDLNTEDSDGMDFDLGDESLELGENQDEQIENIGELSFDEPESELPPSLGDENENHTKDSDNLNFNSSENNANSEVEDGDLSDEAMQKLKEIDALMDFDASQVEIKAAKGLSEELEDDLLSLNSVDDPSLEFSEDLLGGDNLSDDLLGENSLSSDLNDDLMSLSLNDNLSEIDQVEISSENNLDTPLVSDDLDLGSIDFSVEETPAPVKEEKSKKKVSKETKESKETQEEKASYDGSYGKELREISGAYSGEMERMQATISNLRLDREELLTKIQNLEEGKIIQNRQQLTMRAELDEKKIELSIIRKKLNDEIGELKDRVKLFEEKKLILEEKNKILLVELDKSAQKNKIDIKKIQLREKELEQKLELLKSDSEAQIRNRDLKILELKRKLDSMEFDMESISVQEKKSVESRFELEDKLDKAIKTLRSAISVLEDESDKKTALEALKKNIDM